ncbi:hypothetical protein O181_059432 [Austropuccinia psidii MF-1]|uniref:Uncharacterized protein n=1 Tax=Austropuccinia psidii MF-1 TaxID=1389203 RepID=A0A9Q3HXF1_9BASI|nr:hypothetical protein [Austropuccinia psidii MF-1]
MQHTQVAAEARLKKIRLDRGQDVHKRVASRGRADGQQDISKFPLIMNSSSLSQSAPKDDEVNLQEVQDKLEVSLENIRQMVDSWIPSNLRAPEIPNAEAASWSASNLQSFNPTNSRLGLGSIPEKQSSFKNNSSQLRHQLTKKTNSNKRDDPNECSAGSGGELEEEDSRASAIKNREFHKSDSFSLFQQPPSCIEKSDISAAKSTTKDLGLNSSRQAVGFFNASGNLSKRQMKKQRKLERMRLASQSSIQSSASPNFQLQSDKTTPVDTSSPSSHSALWTVGSNSTRTTPDTQQVASFASNAPELPEASKANCAQRNFTSNAENPPKSKKSKKRKRR